MPETPEFLADEARQGDLADTPGNGIAARLIAEGRLEPAEDPEAVRKAEPVDRGISAAQIDAAVEEDRSR